MAGLQGKQTDDPAVNQVIVKLTSAENELLNKCTWELRLSKSDVVRKGIELVYSTLVGTNKPA